MESLSEARWECCVCKEGFEYFPARPLGVYVFAARVPGGGLRTAMYFVCIHQECHDASPSARRQGE